MKRLRLVYLVTHPITALNLMRGQLAFMHKAGMEVFLISSPAEELKKVGEREGITVIPIPIEREIRPWKDLLTLVNLYRKIKKLRPDILNAGTPKAGFLGMIAASVARVPLRIYTLRGLRLETKKGATRLTLTFTERIASALAHRVICVSESLMRKYIELRLVSESKAVVLCSGSSNGVDVNRFHMEDRNRYRKETREGLGIPEHAQVIGFVGRLTKDKGFAELLDVLKILERPFPHLYLVILGDFEAGDPVEAGYEKQMRRHPQIIRTGFVADSANFYPVMDVLVFPSHREGFPNAPLEAAAMGIPTVGFHVTGTVDAVQDGITGRLVAAGDIPALSQAVAAYLENEDLRKQHGRAAQERVVRLFKPEQIWQALHQEYLQLAQKKETIRPDPSECIEVVR